MIKKETELRVVFCNTDSLENAKLIASNLVELKIAACVSIIHGVTSVYEWEGKIESREEYTLKIKTATQKLGSLEARILELHNDKVPEILCISVDESLVSYSKWVRDYLE